ncbi:MAG TPA: glycosyltransferase family 2 protein [Ktedonobacterales bacterium]
MDRSTPRPHVGAQDEPATSPPELPRVSVVMPVRNEAHFIARSLGAVLAQDYPADRVEVLLVDGCSEDETLAVARSLPGAERVRVLVNPARVQAAGMNLALRQARGDIVVRADGHTVLAPDYLRQCVATLRRASAANAGGRMDASTDPMTVSPTGLAVALATRSRFGVPTAFHTSVLAQETDTVYLGAWPRKVLEQVGGFDERLRANEDYELNYRIRRAGGRIYLNPAIRSTYFPRQSLSALARQYLGYGQGKARMLAKHPASVQPRQLVAPAFVAAGVLGALLWRIPPVRALWLATLAAYASLNAAASLRLIRASATHATGTRVPWTVRGRLPLVFLTIHLAWGVGFWMGLLAVVIRWIRREAGQSARAPDVGRVQTPRPVQMGSEGRG